jgi:hypothetical protein
MENKLSELSVDDKIGKLSSQFKEVTDRLENLENKE